VPVAMVITENASTQTEQCDHEDAHLHISPLIQSTDENLPVSACLTCASMKADVRLCVMSTCGS